MMVVCSRRSSSLKAEEANAVVLANRIDRETDILVHFVAIQESSPILMHSYYNHMLVELIKYQTLLT